MRISDRYRQVYEGVAEHLTKLEKKAQEIPTGVLQSLYSGVDELELHLESVGEIPQIKLEQKLSPVLLTVHSCLDRARVLLEASGMEPEAVSLWELEQKVYRLLNDL